MKYPSPSTRRLLDLARGQDDPTPAKLAHVATALNTKLAQGPSLAKAAPPAGSPVLTVKSVGTLIVASALVGAGWIGLRAVRASPPVVPTRAASPSDPASQPHLENARPTESSAASTAATTAPPAVEAVPSSPPLETARARVSRKPTHTSAERAAPAAPQLAQPIDELRAEAAALRLAEEALRDGSPGQALSLLEEQDGRFSHGRLQQERAAARVLALCQQGRVTEARAQAARFERTWPHSGLRARIQSACWAR